MRGENVVFAWSNLARYVQNMILLDKCIHWPTCNWQVGNVRVWRQRWFLLRCFGNRVTYTLNWFQQLKRKNRGCFTWLIVRILMIRCIYHNILILTIIWLCRFGFLINYTWKIQNRIFWCNFHKVCFVFLPKTFN